MNTHLLDDKWRAAAANEYAHLPVTYHVTLAPELARAVKKCEVVDKIKAETLIAEAVRAYLGVCE